MKLLLDTCALIWAVSDPERLTPFARDGIAGADSISLSAVTGIEVAIKFKSGKLRLTEPPSAWFEQARAALALFEIPITLEHSLAAGALPLHHRDPFDRLLIAQARAENLTLVTPDPVFARYGISLMW